MVEFQEMGTPNRWKIFQKLQWKLEIDVVVDEMGENAEMETSLNLNISSISDTPEEGLNHDSEKKKKIQPFCETRERQCCPSYKARARQ